MVFLTPPSPFSLEVAFFSPSLSFPPPNLPPGSLFALFLLVRPIFDTAVKPVPLPFYFPPAGEQFPPPRGPLSGIALLFLVNFEVGTPSPPSLTLPHMRQGVFKTPFIRLPRRLSIVINLPLLLPTRRQTTFIHLFDQFFKSRSSSTLRGVFTGGFPPPFQRTPLLPTCPHSSSVTLSKVYTLLKPPFSSSTDLPFRFFFVKSFPVDFVCASPPVPRVLNQTSPPLLAAALGCRAFRVFSPPETFFI